MYKMKVNYTDSNTKSDKSDFIYLPNISYGEVYEMLINNQKIMAEACISDNNSLNESEIKLNHMIKLEHSILNDADLIRIIITENKTDTDKADFHCSIKCQDFTCHSNDGYYFGADNFIITMI